jgi:hypothetical protein
MLIVLYSVAIDDIVCTHKKQTVMRLLGAHTHKHQSRALIERAATNNVPVACRHVHPLLAFFVIWKGAPHALVACRFGEHAAITGSLVACAFSSRC